MTHPESDVPLSASSLPTSELAKMYKPADVEPAILDRWNQAKAFHADAAAKGEPYSIVIPPPNVTAALHLGHALNNTLQDILIRWRRMVGDNVLWMPGTDHAGIATQTVVEKRVLKEEGKRRTEFKREEFVAKIQAWKDEYEQRITEQLKTMGCSCDWDRQRFTMDEVCAAAVREAFYRLFADGLIYRGKRLVNWDPATQTALADDEVEMQEVDGFFYYMKYPLADGSGHVTVATTRPETMLGDTAVAINPKDPRAAELAGKKIKLPIVNREIPIIQDEYVVLPDPNAGDEKAKFSSGFLKVTPAHDPNDWALGQKFGLAVINVMAPDATISRDHGWPSQDADQADAFLNELLGKDRQIARKMILRWFDDRGLLEEKRPYRHSVGHSYRSHVPVEPYLSDQWYVAVKKEFSASHPAAKKEGGFVSGTDVPSNSLAGLCLRALNPSQRSGAMAAGESTNSSAFEGEGGEGGEGGYEGGLTLTPERYAKPYQTWNENLRDWCISRQLWWGHRIPVWSPPTGTPGIPATALTPALGSSSASSSDIQSKIDSWQSQGRLAKQGDHGFVCIRRSDDAEIVQALEAAGYVQDVDVLDTWFSSALWPISTLGWPNPGKFPDIFPDGDAPLSKWNPSATLSTAREILTLWVSRMVMFNGYFRACLPFRNVFIHAMIQDGQGRKMSKSLGNGVDPLDIIHSHGSDAMRFTLAQMTTQTQDVRLPVVQDAATGRNTSEKFDIGRNFSNKVWNATRFACSSLSPMPPWRRERKPLELADRWILGRLAQTVQETDKALNSFEFSAYAQGLYDFFWRDLCDWYIEITKPTLKENPAQQVVLATCLDVSLRLLHPVMPFITESLWESLNQAALWRYKPDLTDGVTIPASSLLIQAPWPKVSPSSVDQAAVQEMSRLQEVIVAIRQARNTYKIAPKQKLVASVKASGEIAALLQQHQAIVRTLAGTELSAISDAAPRPSDAAVCLVHGAEIYLHGLVQADAEQARLAKRLEELDKSIRTLESRLNNKSYTDRAPAKLVQETRDQLTAAQQEAANVKEQLERLK